VQVVGVDVVDVRGEQLAPQGLAGGSRYVGGRPEADLVAGVVGCGHDVVQLGLLVLRHRTDALPGEDVRPVVADERHQ
jgi:hypothetical protein